MQLLPINEMALVSVAILGIARWPSIRSSSTSRRYLSSPRLAARRRSLSTIARGSIAGGHRRLITAWSAS
jgi:hypothetical protein